MSRANSSLRVRTLSVGDELLLGQIVDTNAAYLAERLSLTGVKVTGHEIVGDDQGEIEDAVRRAAQKADWLVVSGGIGPTQDDLTREAAAAAAGVSLVLIPEALEHIRHLFARRGRSMPSTNTKQATIPEGAEWIPNKRGTAAGFCVKIGGCRVVCMPGVPHEMRGMFEEDVLPRIRACVGDTANQLIVRKLHCIGVSESKIDELLGDLMKRDREPKVGLQASDGIITIRVVGKASMLSEIETTLGHVRRVLDENIFGEDGETLPEAVVRILGARHKTIAVAESCTGGLICHLLTEVPGVSAQLVEGLVTYSNEAKIRRLGVPRGMIEEHGAVSEPVARAMARGVRESLGVDFGLGVTGIAGPSGGTKEKPVGLVYIAVADKHGETCQKNQFIGGRQAVQRFAAYRALDLLRRVILGVAKTGS